MFVGFVLLRKKFVLVSSTLETVVTAHKNHGARPLKSKLSFAIPRLSLVEIRGSSFLWSQFVLNLTETKLAMRPRRHYTTFQDLSSPIPTWPTTTVEVRKD